VADAKTEVFEQKVKYTYSLLQGPFLHTVGDLGVHEFISKAFFLSTSEIELSGEGKICIIERLNKRIEVTYTLERHVRRVPCNSELS
jgi:hypothetical protein